MTRLVTASAAPAAAPGRALVALVPAAGVGTRAMASGTLPKQYRLLGGEPMLRRAVAALLADARIGQVQVLVSAGDAWGAQVLAGMPRVLVRRCGGVTRADTVRQGLVQARLPDDTWVLVHDAARPGLPQAALARLIDTCRCEDRGGLLALPVTDTVKRARAAKLRTGAVEAAGIPPDEAALRCKAPLSEVAATLPRDGIWAAQTPQMFRAGTLLAALQACAHDPDITDEASAVERATGEAPLLVQGARENFKLTWPEDFAWFERMIAPGVLR